MAAALGQTLLGDAVAAIAVRDAITLPADDAQGRPARRGAAAILGGMLAAAADQHGGGRVRSIGGAFVFAGTGGLTMAAILQF